MITADNEVGTAMVLADERVPDGLARSAHSHGKRKHGEFHGCRWIFGDQQLVAAYTCEVIHIARLGHADGRVNQQVGLDLFSGTESQFLVSAMHGITSLKCNYPPPSQT